MYNLSIVLTDGSQAKITGITSINMTNPKDNSVNTINEAGFELFVPYASYFYNFISQDEIFTTFGQNIKTLYFYE